MAQQTGEPSSSLASEEIPTSVSPSLALTFAVSSPLLVQETSQPLYLEQGPTLVDLVFVTEATVVTMDVDLGVFMKVTTLPRRR